MVSKFKNAVPKLPKKEQSLSELPIQSQDIASGKSITCNTENIYFSLGGGDVGIVPNRATGRRLIAQPSLRASGNNLVSLASTFLDPSLLATASQSSLKIWASDQIQGSGLSLVAEFQTVNNGKIYDIAFHPCSNDVRV